MRSYPVTARHTLSRVIVAALLVASHGLHVVAQTEPKAKSAPDGLARTDTSALLRVSGDLESPLALSADDFAKLKRQTVKAKGHDGIESQYEGVPLVDILAKAGVPVGKDLRGAAMALYLVVEASDNYRAAFSLAELDPAFAERVILLADRRDGRPLSAREGPLQVIVPGEKKHARWVRQVIRIKVGRG